jgi:hypothetical protein
MALKIVKRTGIAVPLENQAPAPTAFVAEAKKKDRFVKQPELIDSHCGFLARMPATALNAKDHVQIAALLGFGSKEAQETLWQDFAGGGIAASRVMEDSRPD